MNRIKNALTLLVLVLLLVACVKDKYQNSNNKTFHVGANTYVGSKNCVECHKDAYNTWQGSHHDLAMQEANESNVLGDFNNVTTEIDRVKYLFYKKDENFHVLVKDLDSTEIDYKIAYAFGVTPLQQYLVDFEDGKKQVLQRTKII